MFQFNNSGIFKFLLGIVLLQAVTAIQVLAAVRSHSLEVWILLATLSLVIGILTALWFSSILHKACLQAIANIKDGLSKKQEHLRRQAEMDKVKQQERAKTEAKATSKFGVPLMGAMCLAGVGTVVLVSQIITIGLLAITAAGGALAGYIAGYHTRKAQQGLERWGRWTVLSNSQSVPDLHWEQSQQNSLSAKRGRKRPPLVIVQDESETAEPPSSPANR